MNNEDALNFMINEKKFIYDYKKKMIIVIFNLLALGN